MYTCALTHTLHKYIPVCAYACLRAHVHVRMCTYYTKRLAIAMTHSHSPPVLCLSTEYQGDTLSAHCASNPQRGAAPMACATAVLAEHHAELRYAIPGLKASSLGMRWAHATRGESGPRTTLSVCADDRAGPRTTRKGVRRRPAMTRALPKGVRRRSLELLSLSS